jgi:hypothetical protein
MFRHIYIYIYIYMCVCVCVCVCVKREYVKRFSTLGTLYSQKRKLNYYKMHKNACFDVNAYFSVSLQTTL